VNEDVKKNVPPQARCRLFGIPAAVIMRGAIVLTHVRCPPAGSVIQVWNRATMQLLWVLEAGTIVLSQTRGCACVWSLPDKPLSPVSGLELFRYSCKNPEQKVAFVVRIAVRIAEFVIWPVVLISEGHCT
jgi:hypothetical protein